MVIYTLKIKFRIGQLLYMNYDALKLNVLENPHINNQKHSEDLGLSRIPYLEHYISFKNFQKSKDHQKISYGKHYINLKKHSGNLGYHTNFSEFDSQWVPHISMLN